MKAVRMLLTNLLLLLVLTTLTLEEEDGQCGGILSIIPFVDVLDAMKYYSRCTFPAYKLNASCILSSCPSLRGVCPLTSNKSVNQAALNASVSILTTCLRQSGLICGVNMSSTPMVITSWTTTQFVPLSMANGTSKINPGTGYFSNLSKAKFTVNQTVDKNGLITLDIEANNIIGECDCNGNFSVPSTSILTTLKPLPFASDPLPFSSLPSLDFLNTPNMHANIQINVSSTVSIDLKAQPPSVQTIHFQSNIQSVYSNFVTLGGVYLPPIVEEVFNEGMESFFKESVVPSTTAKFLSTYAALALQGAQESCP